MSDDLPPPDPAVPASVPAALPPAAGPRRRRTWLVAIALLAMAGAVAWLAWNLDRSERAEAYARDHGAKLERRLAALEDAQQAQARQQRSLDTRLTDATATNKVLREELLGMGERASLLEDAVARLADNRLRGEVVMRLNEAEFLLLLGEERLRLFGDVPAAVQAYQLADAALAGLDDPVLATLRQTLAQELLALRQVPADPRPALRAELARLADGLEALPASRSGELRADAASDSRLVRLLAQLVTVRRVDARDGVLGPVQRETLTAALRLQLQLAQAALARPDPAAYAHALEQAGVLVARLFDPEAPAVVQLRATLDRLRATTLVPELPVLGATLQELRGLRAARSVGALPAAPAPAAEPVPPASERAAPAPEGGE